MNSTIAIGVMVLSSFLASISQVLLKKSAKRTYSQKIKEFVNPYVISGYILLMLTMVMNVFAFQYLPYKVGPIISTLSYVFVFLLSYFIFKEKITKQKFLGIILIICGVLLFNL